MKTKGENLIMKTQAIESGVRIFRNFVSASMDLTGTENERLAKEMAKAKVFNFAEVLPTQTTQPKLAGAINQECNLHFWG